MKTHIEFAEQYKQNPSNENLGKILQEFHTEIKELFPGLHTNDSFRTVIRQQNTKWKLFAKMTGLNPLGYKLVSLNLFKDLGLKDIFEQLD